MGGKKPSMEEAMPAAFAEAQHDAAARSVLKSHYRDMQDVEFTVAGAASLYHAPNAQRANAPRKPR